MPIKAPRAAANGRELTAQFMVASLNLDRFAQVTTMIGGVAVTSLLSALFLVVLAWQREVTTRESYEEAFKTVDGVLYGATTAYCRLDTNDGIQDCNTAFCDLLGRRADGQSVQAMKGLTFESLLAPRSKGTYKSVQERRKRHEDVEPYTLYFSRADGSEIETRVTSGVIPGRPGPELPGTFGIVIPSPNG